MNNTPILTIIIPCYNATPYLKRCTSSLEGLNNQEVSLLFINDGSTDSTAKEIREWLEYHSNARMLEKENGGYSTAINMGLDNCQTEYVMFLGVDDEIVSLKINEICAHLRENQPDILFFSTEKAYDDRDCANELDRMTHYAKPGVYHSDVFELYKRFGTDIRILFTRDTSRCFNLKAIGNLRYFGKTGVSADGCFSSIVAIHAQTFEFVNERCYIWHLHKDSVSSRSRPVGKLVEELGVWKAYFARIKTSLIHKELPSFIVDHFFVYLRQIYGLYNMNETQVAKEHLDFAWGLSKWFLKNTNVELKSRVKLMFPRIYLFLRNG